MKTRSYQSYALFFSALLLLLLATAGVLTGRAWRQEAREQALIAAIRRDDTQEAIRLLKQGADANAHAPSTRYFFHQAVWERLCGRSKALRPNSPTALQIVFADEEDTQKVTQAMPKRQEPVALVQALLARGANIRVTDAFGVPVVVYAAVYRSNNGEKNLACVKLLLDAGADVDAETRTGNSLLLCALKSNDLRLAQLLLSRGAHCQMYGEDIPALGAARHYDNPSPMLALLKKYGFND